MNLKKVNNYTQNLYYLLSSRKFSKNTGNIATGDDSSDIKEELSLLRARVQERFRKAAKAFKYFDTSNKGIIKFNEFELGTIKLGFSFNQILTHKIFNYIDTDHDERIQYSEFCDFWEEEKQDFKYHSAQKTTERSASVRQRPEVNTDNKFNRSFSIKSSPIDDFISQSVTNNKLKQRK